MHELPWNVNNRDKIPLNRHFKEVFLVFLSHENLSKINVSHMFLRRTIQSNLAAYDCENMYRQLLAYIII